MKEKEDLACTTNDFYSDDSLGNRCYMAENKCEGNLANIYDNL